MNTFSQLQLNKALRSQKQEKVAIEAEILPLLAGMQEQN